MSFRFELLGDINILLMFQKAIESGISQAVKRSVKTNTIQ